MKIPDWIIDELNAEFDRATTKFPPLNSAHEGHGVIAEEWYELCNEIYKKQSDPSRSAGMREEAIQIAAMAIRFLHDLKLRSFKSRHLATPISDALQTHGTIKK